MSWEVIMNWRKPLFLAFVRLLLVFIGPALIHRQVRIFQQEDFVNNYDFIHNENNETYDFIIVGGGSAGSVLANRLTAPPNQYRVLLLEAGGNPNWITYVAGYNVISSRNPGTDWMYESEPQTKGCLSCKHQQIGSWRGKALGGGSTENFLVYNRGNPRCFDEWAEISGDPSWSYGNVLNYFMKSEDYHGNYPDASVHGCGGELRVGKQAHYPGMEYLLPAIRENGMVEQDINANQTNAYMKMDQTSDDTTRWSAYLAFLEPILGRRNLRIKRYAHCTRLLFSPAKPNVVTGVEYVWHNVTKYAFATREVILSAGSYNSPQIMMLSGIGPRGHLEELEIPVKVDLPVGKNLQDHPTTIFTITFNKSQSSELFEREGIPGFMTDFLYPPRFGNDLNKQNFFDSSYLASTAYISSKFNDDVNFPDIEVFQMILGTSHVGPVIFERLLNIDEHILASFLSPWTRRDGNFILVSLVKPRSIGYVKLNGTDPLTPPIINPNLFSDQNDMDIKIMAQGMKFMVEFFENSPSYKRINAQLIPKKWKGCHAYKFKSLEYYECHIRHVTFTLWHPSGTCKMGKRDDPTAVVDSRLRVLGIENLRIVDNSIMPKITNGNTNAPAIMIGEKASDMIIQDWLGYTTPPRSQRRCDFDRRSTHTEL